MGPNGPIPLQINNLRQSGDERKRRKEAEREMAAMSSRTDAAGGQDPNLIQFCHAVAEGVDIELEVRRYPAQFRERARQESLSLASGRFEQGGDEQAAAAEAVRQVVKMFAEDLRWRVGDRLEKFGLADKTLADRTDQAVNLIAEEQYSLPDGQERTADYVVDTVVATIAAS